MIRTFLLFTLLAGLTGTVAVWQIQIPDAGETTSAQDDTWQLPHKPQAPNYSKSYNRLRKLNPWNTTENGDYKTGTSSKSSRRKGKKNQKWKFVGIVKKGNQRYILLLENKKITQYAVKSSLPNGNQLIKIHNDSIEIMQDNKVEVVHLYKKK